ncbi:discoidin domain-containing protein [Granulicella sp. L46]|uniref:glycosyl hydrolase 2 galactose-binding domain-containing protein n=1 Tax=Granulicella sp. L46 TaxID=1641865 RepID=UPI00131A8CA5|nr:discoidin domain-containing protein [Granulicella sp. L46]
MSLSRRAFLKSSMIAAGEVALPTLGAAATAGAEMPVAAGAPVEGVEAEVVEGAKGEFTRGLGIYPGAAGDVFSPTMRVDATTYRNLALRRAAKHSSSYDYNLTAQLVTDGIKETRIPRWVAVSTSVDGVLTKPDREIVLDHFPPVGLKLEGEKVWAQVEVGGGEAPAVDRLRVFVALPEWVAAKDLRFSVAVSDDGRAWEQVGSAKAEEEMAGENYPPDLLQGTKLYYPWLTLSRVCASRFYRVTCEWLNHPEARGISWMVGQVEFYRGGARAEIGGPYDFTSAWMSAGSGEEWVSVDLGARCAFDRVALYWIARAAEGAVQISDDEVRWTEVHRLGGGGASTENVEEIRLAAPAHARFLRVLMTRPTSPFGYILSELEVWGRGGPVAVAASVPAMSDGRMLLAGGAWRVERRSVVTGDGAAVSRVGFADAAWIVATVPGTVLTSFYNAGTIADPNFGENQLYVSDSYFCADFWYRTEFEAPAVEAGEIAWLDFEGVNWKAQVFLNGEALGRIDGGFLRAQFDVTGKLLAGKKNALAVLIEKNATPGSTKQKTFENPSRNGGALGADNPTYHASIGWDWIPTIRGRNTGIWGDVSLTKTGAVTLEAPWVRAELRLPDTSAAELSVQVGVVNHRASAVEGTLRFRFGAVEVSQAVTVAGGSTAVVTMDASKHAELRLKDPQLWWPAGYGAPYLYDVEIRFEVPGRTLDSKKLKFGIRQMTSSEAGGKLTLFVNGRRFICRGGNWGFSESMLRYRGREYDAAVRYHREMNFTMIRNWVGQIGDETFYEACDRHGVMVWQDFWLANPWDGPVPDDDAMFMANARDFISRIRNHASIGLYCGRNEGYPPKVLEAGLRAALAELHPGIQYIPSSADDVVSGHGPYHALPPVEYFRIADSKLHSEIGMPNIPPVESVRLMMPERAMWPQGLDWGLHDFSLNGAQGAKSFYRLIDESYGGADSAEQWISLAQFVNFEGYRAMFESQSKYRAGLLLWMSHPCWPSFVWQTYDYFFEPTAAYFGCKLASEPLHIQWNRDAETIEVVNYSGGDRRGLSARVEIFNMDGARVGDRAVTIDSKEDSVVAAVAMQYPKGLSAVHFLRLTLMQGTMVISRNDYVRSLVEGDYRAIRSLAKARVQAATTVKREGEIWRLTTELQNGSAWPALMTRVKAVRAVSGDRILPAIYDDNYVLLMPGEHRTIQTELQHADTRGETPKIVVSGFNVA